MWNPFKKKSAAPLVESDALSNVRWIEASENPWGVRLVDLRPFAQTMISTSRDPAMATNAISFLTDDGTGFVGQEPPLARTVDCALRFPIDRVLAEGALFQPQTMEEKWALYFHGGRVLCIRSWTRELRVVADVRCEGGEAIIGPLHGAFVGPDEGVAQSVRMLDFVLRTHALLENVPAPLASAPTDLKAVALECFSLWGNRALVATHSEIVLARPSKPLRTDSLLHIAVARGDRETAVKQLRTVPIDLLARGGLTAGQWALASRDPDMLAWLLDRGSPVDARSAEGATALMNAVQSRKHQLVLLLLDRGADVNARDDRGFTSLHRAAEIGEPEIARTLLARGADPAIEAQGWTAKRLAEKHQRADIVALFPA